MLWRWGQVPPLYLLGSSCLLLFSSLHIQSNCYTYIYVGVWKRMLTFALWSETGLYVDRGISFSCCTWYLGLPASSICFLQGVLTMIITWDIKLNITFLNPSRLCLRLAVSQPFGPPYPQHSSLLKTQHVILLSCNIWQLYIPVAASENTQRHCDWTPCTSTLCLRGIETPSPISASTASETVKLTSGFPGCFEKLLNFNMVDLRNWLRELQTSVLRCQSVFYMAYAIGVGSREEPFVDLYNTNQSSFCASLCILMISFPLITYDDIVIHPKSSYGRLLQASDKYFGTWSE